MKREIIRTADGSASLYLPEWDETYHSRHGAIQEARHVFLKNGLEKTQASPVHILEIGFGTGLNAFLTLEASGKPILYTGIEAFPLSSEEYRQMDYAKSIGNPGYEALYLQLMEAEWGDFKTIRPGFELRKLQHRIESFREEGSFDLIYFDAFGFRVQPELWSAEIFRNMYDSLRDKGILVTYAARSIIRKNLQSAGFRTQTLPGPPGKREMTYAVKD